jgi:DNA adenine methylase
LPIVEKAARTIYLNRTCYNGLYRVNKQGFFNTPIGRNSSIQIVNEKGILGISEYLNMAKVEILNGDYHIPLQIATKNDFVFLDPPYYPTNKDSFLRYDVSPFGIQEQLDLKEVCDQLNEKNIRFIETNSDCEEIRKLYSEYRQIEVDVRRCINAKVNGRRGKELIICNY